MLKSDKKVWKMHPPSKTPKCHLNGQKPHFVKSEPPGWALFEFQGVPRDPVLRPKMTPSFLNVKVDHIFDISCFSICTFWSFLCFHVLVKLIILYEVPFFDTMLCTVIRPYCNCNRGRTDLCVVVLPSFGVFCFCYCSYRNFKSGRFTGEENYNFNSRSPLCGFVYFMLMVLFVVFKMTGRFTG